MGVDGDGAAVDTPVASDDAVGVDGFLVAGGAGQGADFDEGAFVEKRGDALARGGVPGVVAALPRALRTGVLRFF